MLDSSPFPAQDSVLSSRAIADRLLPLYGLALPYSCQFHRKGICDTYQIPTSDGGFYLKVYRAGRRSRRDVSEEVKLLNHLLQHGVSVVKPIPRLDGEFVSELPAPEGMRCAVLFLEVTGDSEQTDRHRWAFGAEAAKMHAAADLLPDPSSRQHLDIATLLAENMVHIGRLMAHRPQDFRLIEAIADHTGERVTSLLPRTTPEYGFCHGDLHGGDVLYAADGRPTLLDFDSSGHGWRAIDLGVYLNHDWMNTSADAEALRQQKLSVFLDGYQSVRRLSDAELTVLQLTPAIRHIFLMGHVLRHTTVYQGWSWANDSFIDWHLQWFRHWRERGPR